VFSSTQFLDSYAGYCTTLKMVHCMLLLLRPSHALPSLKDLHLSSSKHITSEILALHQKELSANISFRTGLETQRHKSFCGTTQLSGDLSGDTKFFLKHFERFCSSLLVFYLRHGPSKSCQLKKLHSNIKLFSYIFSSILENIVH